MGFEWRDTIAAWGAIVATIVAILRVWDKYKERERLYLGYQLVSDSDKTKPVKEWRLTATNVGTKPVVVVAFGVFDFLVTYSTSGSLLSNFESACVDS